MNSSLLVRALACSIVIMLLLPGLANACNVAFRTIGPIDVRKSAIERPSFRLGARAAWKLDSSWRATRPELNQDLRVRGGGTYRGASYPKQRALSIDAPAPVDAGWRYGDDADPETPPCEIAGRGEWQAPKILVKETRRTVRIAAASQRTVGDRTGCVLGAGQDEAGCPTMTRSIVKLKRPLGNRQIHFELIR